MRKNGTSSCAPAYLSAHGYVLALGRHLPYISITGAMRPPSYGWFAHPSWIAGMKMMLDLLLGAPQTQVSAITPFLSPTCSSLCQGFFSWGHLLKRTCLMSKWKVFWEALLFLQHCYMGSSPTIVPNSWWSTSIQIDCVNGILVMKLFDT